MLIRVALSLFVLHAVAASVSPPVVAGERYTQALRANAQIEIGYEKCLEIENKLGQLFYVNVDGFKGPEDQAIHPEYIRMVNELGIGGVLPKFGLCDWRAKLASSKALQEASKLPLMIGIDKEPVCGRNRVIPVGLGFGGGFLQQWGGKTSESCIVDRALIEAFLHKTIGLNQALGPTLERNPRFGFLDNSPEKVASVATPLISAFNQLEMVTTLKHFPYTPASFNLHDRNEDTKLPAQQVRDMLRIFKEMAGRSEFAMTTHLWNSQIDPEDMATFSEKWMKILRNEMTFQGLVMSDALFMFSKYEATVQAMASRWVPQEKVKITDKRSIFAARTLLSGHDMVFLEGTASSTRQVFKDLHYIACQNTRNGQLLRKRILESHGRVAAFKKRNEEKLRRMITPPESLVEEAIQMLGSPEPCPRVEDMVRFKKSLGKLKFYAVSENAGSVPKACPEPDYSSVGDVPVHQVMEDSDAVMRHLIED